jgi:D-glycero-alpha-D-manno-heptose-7-phosphate kinase
VKGISPIFSLRAPLRLSLAGGGTDVEPFASDFGSKILNFSINLFIEVEIYSNANQSEKVRLEISDKYRDIERKSEFTRKIEKYIESKWNLDKPIFISIHNPVRRSSGLGTSSVIISAVIQCLAKVSRRNMSKKDIINEAFKAERIEMKISGGFQDYFPCAYGGINWIEQQGTVYEWDVTPIKPREKMQKLFQDGLFCVELDVEREGTKIIDDQISRSRKAGSRTQVALKEQLKNAHQVKRAVLEDKTEELMELLALSYQLKKRYSPHISNERTEEAEQVLRKLGGEGIKLSGAGGGGHMFCFFPRGIPEFSDSYLPNFMKRIPCSLEERGMHEF